MPNRLFTRFTTGQFAALHGISKKTLMWYDEMGLIHPVAVGENGYRYYNYYQSSELETILQLRDLGISIPDIRKFMEHRSPAVLQGLLQDSLTALEQKLRQLHAIQKDLQLQLEAMTRLQDLDLNAITLVHQPEHTLAVIKTDKHTPIETGIGLMLNEVKKRHVTHLYSATYGSMIPVSNLYAGKFYDYTAMFMMVSAPPDQENLHIQPAGQYLRAYSKGTWDRIPDRYRELLRFCDAQGLELTGYSYENCINERVINSMDDYITQILIPVRSKPAQ